MASSPFFGARVGRTTLPDAQGQHHHDHHDHQPAPAEHHQAQQNRSAPADVPQRPAARTDSPHPFSAAAGKPRHHHHHRRRRPRHSTKQQQSQSQRSPDPKKDRFTTLPLELTRLIISLLPIPSLIALRSASTAWRQTVRTALPDALVVDPARAKLVALWDYLVQDPSFLASRPHVVPLLAPFDREAFLRALLPPETKEEEEEEGKEEGEEGRSRRPRTRRAGVVDPVAAAGTSSDGDGEGDGEEGEKEKDRGGDLLPHAFAIWVREWPAKAAIAGLWPGLPADMRAAADAAAAAAMKGAGQRGKEQEEERVDSRRWAGDLVEFARRAAADAFEGPMPQFSLATVPAGGRARGRSSSNSSWLLDEDEVERWSRKAREGTEEANAERRRAREEMEELRRYWWLPIDTNGLNAGVVGDASRQAFFPFTLLHRATPGSNSSSYSANPANYCLAHRPGEQAMGLEVSLRRCMAHPQEETWDVTFESRIWNGNPSVPYLTRHRRYRHQPQTRVTERHVLILRGCTLNAFNGRLLIDDEEQQDHEARANGHVRGAAMSVDGFHGRWYALKSPGTWAKFLLDQSFAVKDRWEQVEEERKAREERERVKQMRREQEEEERVERMRKEQQEEERREAIERARAYRQLKENWHRQMEEHRARWKEEKERTESEESEESEHEERQKEARRAEREMAERDNADKKTANGDDKGQERAGNERSDGQTEQQSKDQWGPSIPSSKPEKHESSRMQVQDHERTRRPEKYEQKRRKSAVAATESRLKVKEKKRKKAMRIFRKLFS